MADLAAALQTSQGYNAGMAALKKRNPLDLMRKGGAQRLANDVGTAITNAKPAGDAAANAAQNVAGSYDQGITTGNKLMSNAGYGQALQNVAMNNMKNAVFGTPGQAGLMEQMNMRGQTPDSGTFVDALAARSASEFTNAGLQEAQARLGTTQGIGSQAQEQKYGAWQNQLERDNDFAAAQMAGQQAEKDRKDRKNSALAGGLLNVASSAIAA